MTQQQKTIKLAEFEGYKSCGKQFYGGVETWRIRDGTALLPESLPKYFEDLNATHNLEKVFTWDDISTPDPERKGVTFHTNTKAQYQRTLADVIAKEKEQEGMDSLKAFLFGIQESVHATAAHRAEAIGQTLKLWS